MAATEFPNSLKDKPEWLLAFPVFSWRQLVLCGDKRMVQGDFMIDDHAQPVHFAHAFLYTLSQCRYSDYERIDNWKQALRFS
jgi:5'(3')-deoxyribonucleotidase